jgi:zinc protease
MTGCLKSSLRDSFIFFSLSLLGPYVHASSANMSLDLDVEKHKLDNGLTIILSKRPTLPIVSYYTFYGIGGRHEGPGTTGASHFLEHLMFKGTKNNPPGYFDQFIESVGGSNNAYTSFDATVYYENIPSSVLETIIGFEAERMVNLALVPESFESERRVVLEERKYRYENSPFGKLYLQSLRAMFENTPYGGSVIGDEIDVKSINREQVEEYYKNYYAPNNATIVIVGDINPSAVLKQIKKSFASLPFSTRVDEIKKLKDREELFKFAGKYDRELHLKGQSPSPMFLLAFKGAPWGSKDAKALDIIGNVIGGGQSSYLSEQYVLADKPMLGNISSGNYVLKYNGIVYVYGELLSTTKMKDFKKKIFKDLQTICDSAISERSLQKTKNQFLISYYAELQTNSGIAHLLGSGEYFGQDYDNYKKEIDYYNKLGIDEVKQICKNYLKKEHSIFSTIWQNNK